MNSQTMDGRPANTMPYQPNHKNSLWVCGPIFEKFYDELMKKSDLRKT